VQIEKWDSASKKAWLWVKVPSVSSTSDTELYLYYDKDHADNTAYVGDTGSTPAQAVWDTNFHGVWHLSEDPTGTAPQMKDSTSYANHGTTGGPMASGDQLAGEVDGSLNFSSGTGAQPDKYVNCGTGSSLNMGSGDLTLEVWFRVKPGANVKNGVPSGGPFVCKGSVGTAGKRYMLLITGINEVDGGIDDDTVVKNVSSTVGGYDDNAWHYAVLVRDGNNLRLYVDGSEQVPHSPVDITGYGNIDDSYSFYIAADKNRNNAGDPNDFCNCTIDEVRISNNARNAAYVKASYEGERDHFIDYGGEESWAPSSSIMAFIDGEGVAIGTSETTLATLPTSFSAGNNLIAIVEFQSTATLDPAISAGNLKLTRSGTTLRSNQYVIAISSSDPNEQKWFALMAFDSAGANPSYDVRATAQGTGISGEVKILAIGGLTGSSVQGRVLLRSMTSRPHWPPFRQACPRVTT